MFEGKITKAKLRSLKIELASIIDPSIDSVIIYTMESTKYTTIEIMGKKKGGEEIMY